MTVITCFPILVAVHCKRWHAQLLMSDEASIDELTFFRCLKAHEAIAPTLFGIIPHDPSTDDASNLRGISNGDVLVGITFFQTPLQRAIRVYVGLKILTAR